MSESICTAHHARQSVVIQRKQLDCWGRSNKDCNRSNEMYVSIITRSHPPFDSYKSSHPYVLFPIAVPEQEDSANLWALLDPVRLAETRPGSADLTHLLQSLLDMSDVIQQPTALLTALAQALPHAGGDKSKVQLYYSLFAQLCAAATNLEGLAADESDEEAAHSVSQQQGVLTLLRFSDLTDLQKHLSSVFVQAGSAWMSTNDDTTLEGLRGLLHLLQQYEVPITPGFVRECTQICNLHTPQSGTGSG